MDDWTHLLLCSNWAADMTAGQPFANVSLYIMAIAASLNTISADSSEVAYATDGPSSNIALDAILLALITVLAAFLRLHALTAKSFWLDEGISIEVARLPWPQFLHVLWAGEANMGLYYLLLRFWLIMGSGEGFIRGLSVLFSVATIPPMFFLGARLFGRRAGLWAAVLLAVNAYHIRFAQEARGYAMVVFFAVLATWLLARNLQKPSSAHWVIYAAACALTTYSHLFGVLLVPAHAISLLSWRSDEISKRKFARSLLTFGVMIVPVAIFVFTIFVLKTGTPPNLWFPPLEPDSLLLLAVDFSGVYGRILLILDLLAIGNATLGASRARPGGEHVSHAWAYSLLFSWLVAPVVMVVAVSLVKPLFVPRFLIFCLPAMLLLVAVGISRLRPAALSWGLFVAIAVCSIFGDIRYYQRDFDMLRQDWRAVTSYVLDHALPGDSIFFYYSVGEAPFDYYSGRQKSASLRPKTLHEHWLKTGNGKNASDPRPDALVSIPGTDLRATPPAGNRVWLVLMFLDGSRKEVDTGKAVGKWLSNGRQRIDAREFSPLAVALFDRNAASSLPDDNRVYAKH